MINLVFLTRSLDYGGAERDLVTLVQNCNKELFNITVMSFYSGGPLEKELAGHNIRVLNLEKQGRWDVFKFSWNLVRRLRILRPDVLHGYLGIPNLLTIFLKPLFPASKMIWGVKASYIDLSLYGWFESLTFKLECFFSRFADLVIVNSKAGYAYHQLHGFPAGKLRVIPNGINTELFKCDLSTRDKLRKEWGVAKTTKLIGLVGRLDRMKDHPTFLKAVALICRERNDLHFVCVGKGSGKYTQSLYDLTCELSLSEKVTWAGARADMRAVYNALDLATSSSYGEGLSNAIGEAMACGVPCVVTDVGDSAELVGDTGVVVPPQNSPALAEGWKLCLKKNRHEFGVKARSRILENYSVTQLVEQTEKAVLSVL